MEMITEAAIRGLWVTNDIRKGCMEWQLSSSTVLQLFHPSVYQHSAESICFDTERRCKTDVARQVAMTTCVKRRVKDGLVRLCYVLPLRKDNSPRVKF